MTADFMVDIVTPYGREEQLEFIEWIESKPFPIVTNKAYGYVKDSVERGLALGRGTGFHFMFWMETEADAAAFAERWRKYERKTP